MRTILGFLLTLVAGTSVGICMWPLKWARAWKWENYWLFFSVLSLIVVPFALAFAVLPHLADVYASLGVRELVLPFVLGLLWGFAQLGAGICASRLGLAVSGAVLNGIGAAVGTVIPLISLHSDVLFEKSGLLILAGVVVMLIGAACCGWSGYQRETESRQRGTGAGFAAREAAMRQSSYSGSAYLLTLGIAVGSGVLASLLNVALAYGGNIMESAELHGGKSSWAPFAVWPVALLGGSIANIGYAAYLTTRNQTWGRFGGSLREMLNPFLAACLWMGGIALYSSGTTFLGSLGISVGFALFMITLILSGQVAAILTGEWNKMTRRTYMASVAGVGLLVLAVISIGLSKYVGR